MLFQRDGGLQVQVRSTIAALRQLQRPALDIVLVDPNHQRLDSFDVIHVFSAINGNNRAVELANELGVPVVLSGLVSPGWNKRTAWRARIAERLTGRLTQWTVQTSYAQTKRALQLAQIVVALGTPEQKSLVDGFKVAPARIRVLPNGIADHFFRADPGLFRAHTGLEGPFVLMVGAISPYKNQQGLVRAMENLALPVVLIGQAQRQHQDYLQRLLASPQVRWLGPLEHHDSLLASAYAAASVLALPSQGEVLPLVVLEALAAGTPVVMTDESALSLPESGFALRQLRWDDLDGLGKAIQSFVAAPPKRDEVRSLVRAFTWQRVALSIADCYQQLCERESADVV
ncbi:glycosyltransferase [Duganella sp. FT94W]|uniref:Glycosyltransferase n=2 Tax=Duganella lactea TaxID=2692173 RepID=A0ABW9V7T1_9BURK|nr:glycosyltransferase [Duganella lactea]